MTSVQTISMKLMIQQLRQLHLFLLLLLLPVPLFLSTGCGIWKGDDKPMIHANLRTPYPADKVWAVAPMANESGVSVVDTLHISDLLTEEVAQIDGIDVLPVQRVLEAFRAMNIGQLQSPSEAQEVVRLLGVDGLIAGTIITYDPYNPPKLGLTLQLYTVDGTGTSDVDDIRKLQNSPSDSYIIGIQTFRQPVASVSTVLNAADNGVREDLRAYAEGKIQQHSSALGWEKYLMDMDLYTQYVGHRLLEQMLRDERYRLFNLSDVGSAKTANSSFSNPALYGHPPG